MRKMLNFEYAIIFFLVPKREGAIIKGGAIFGGNTVQIFRYTTTELYMSKRVK